MEAETKPERTRLSAEDWELGALELIAESGIGALAVEALARRLGVTKGSFYWHFRTREALLLSALERWERYEERDVLAQIENHRRAASAPARAVPSRGPREHACAHLRRTAQGARPAGGGAADGPRLWPAHGVF